MNNELDQEILVELRKLRRGFQMIMTTCITIVLTIFIFYLWFGRAHPVVRTNLWGAIHEAMEHCEYERAFGYAQQIVNKYPNDYNGYAYLGNISLITGHVKEAEGYYTHADSLFPSEQNEKILATIRERIAREKSANEQK